jgi:DtxR family Mn-dependent transcriptional regulator
MSETLHCPLCGFKFEKTNTVCTHGCPLGKFCKLIKCPNCQYEFPEPSRPLRWLAKWFHPAQKQVGGLDLTQVEAGETVEFAGMAPGAEGRGRALAVYGMTMGARLTLLQKRPAFLLRVGETELALDAEIARQIVVRRAD